MEFTEALLKNQFLNDEIVRTVTRAAGDVRNSIAIGREAEESLSSLWGRIYGCAERGTSIDMEDIRIFNMRLTELGIQEEK